MARTIVAIVDDLFFASKIRGTANALGVSVSFPRHADGVKEIIARDSPALIICDLNSEKFDVMTLARTLKENETTQNIPLLGFLSHVQTDLQRSAKDAGFDIVMPRSVFTNQLSKIISGE